MQTLRVNEPGLPDLQFVLLILALCTSDLETLNIPPALRQDIFNRCWAMLHDEPAPASSRERVLDLRHADELALQAIVEVIRSMLNEHGLTVLTWDHPPSDPTRQTTPEAKPLIDRLQKLYPPDSVDPPSKPG